MKQLIALLLVCAGLSAHAQNTIYSHAIGNWRNGPVVYITPLIETTEASTKAQLQERFRQAHPELKDIPTTDFDVLLFGTKEEGEESRRTLKAKYGMRKLEVVLLEPPVKKEH
jgi:hypothetical protein